MYREYKDLQDRIRHEEDRNNRLFQENNLNRSDNVEYVVNWGVERDYGGDRLYTRNRYIEALENRKIHLLLKEMERMNQKVRNDYEDCAEKNRLLEREFSVSVLE